MPQNDFSIANQGFPAFRADLNSALQALASNSSGSSAPGTTYAYQFWYDTSTNLLKMRNADNNGWITLAAFDQVADEWQIRSAVIQAVDGAGVVIKTDDGTTRLTVADDGTVTLANDLVVTGDIWAATINGIPLRPGVLDPENRVINGAFDFWQRGTSQTTTGYGSADRWLNVAIGGTVTMSRQSFTLGDTLGGNSPTYFLRQTVSGQTLSSELALIEQRIESVRSYAGQTITVLGWARRSSGSGNMALEAVQVFGTGGSPSSAVLIAPQTVTLTGSWAPFAVTVSVPSITGKTLGSNGNDYFEINFFTSAGSDWDARTNSLGLQTIGVDLWGIHIKVGTHTADATSLYRQPELGPELARCQRYYQVCFQQAWNANIYQSFQLPTTMRTTPTVSASHGTVSGASSTGWHGVHTATLSFSWTADSEL